MKHKLYIPYIPQKSTEYAKDALDSGWISWIGDYTEKASNLLAKYSDSKHVILVNNGTSATHLTTIALKHFFPEIKNIIVPSACYVAAYNSIIYENKWKGICVDLNERTWNFQVNEVPKDTAIMAVHNLGNIINVPKLKEKYDCPIIEDNCEGFFGSYNGFASGSKSICSALSFFGNKNITTGEGGAFITSDDSIFEFITKTKGQGQSDQRYIHDILGYNYRMTNIQAALLLGQLEELDYIKEKKQKLFDRYKNNFKDRSMVSVQKTEEGCTHSNWMFAVRFHGLKNYKEAEIFFSEYGIETRPMFYSYNNHAHVKFKGPTTISDKIQKEVVLLPSHIHLTNTDIDYISERVIGLSSILFQRVAEEHDFL
jgi:perosamine synthetase